VNGLEQDWLSQHRAELYFAKVSVSVPINWSDAAAAG